MRTPLVCIAIEVKGREISPLLFLSANFIKAGFPVLIGHRARIWRFFRKDAADIPICYIAKEMANLSEYARPAMNIYSLDEEGGAKFSTSGNCRLAPVKVQDKLRKIFCWGEAYRDFMVANGGDPDKIVASGHPKFDLQEVETFRQTKAEEQLCFPEKFILINSNWASAHYVAGAEALRELHISLKMGLERLERATVKDNHTLQRMIPLIKKLTAAFPDHTIVIRPHPVEDEKHYASYFTAKNILVSKQGNSYSWIKRAVAVIHNDCTTGIEAFTMGKPVISYTGPETNMDSMAVQISQATDDADEVIALVRNAIANNGRSNLLPEEREERMAKLRKLLANIDGQSASDTIVSTVLQDYTMEELPAYTLPKPKSWVYRTAKKGKRIIRNIKLRLSHDAKKNFLKRTLRGKFPGLALSEVLERLERFQVCPPSSGECTVVEYDIDTFLLTPGPAWKPPQEH
ncbi:surface carbohydrate biosynthesis protein [Paucidesulfovibrio gracilis DSM 16080]|uniref:Surface carbohydrate biosynthesis protein n=1 Tax=Paucidesulfovibrio gracilis DSM 16080 TaxID=1121449 RepID=A0A1T4XPA1_9BACT|nr:surface carbohydrate biosynthesis protein [Paucidesulfovibrio gracilis]SKA91357.1 surface carbohydrate biosynthesis protein [Paucidesulfovibrio gracilis DSM 16080]